MNNEIVLGIITIAISYLLGSIPTAYIVVRRKKGVDIRDVDVGNVGAAATYRVAGMTAGTIVLIVDMAKGAAAILISQTMGLSPPWVLGAGFAAVLGHAFPVYIGFKGGQGVATIVGVFLILAPEATGIVLALTGIALFFARRVIVAIWIAAPFLPVLVWVFERSGALLIFSLVVFAFLAAKNLPGLRRGKSSMEDVKDNLRQLGRGGRKED